MRSNKSMLEPLQFYFDYNSAVIFMSEVHHSTSALTSDKLSILNGGGSCEASVKRTWNVAPFNITSTLTNNEHPLKLLKGKQKQVQRSAALLFQITTDGTNQGNK